MTDSLNLIAYLSIALLSLAMPMCIFIGRNNVRSSRGQIVDDLAKLFNFAKEQGGTPLIVPSFELVKYKGSSGNRVGKSHGECGLKAYRD